MTLRKGHNKRGLNLLLKDNNYGGVTLINEVEFFITVAKVRFLKTSSKFFLKINTNTSLITKKHPV